MILTYGSILDKSIITICATAFGKQKKIRKTKVNKEPASTVVMSEHQCIWAGRLMFVVTRHDFSVLD